MAEPQVPGHAGRPEPEERPAGATPVVVEPHELGRLGACPLLGIVVRGGHGVGLPTSARSEVSGVSEGLGRGAVVDPLQAGDHRREVSPPGPGHLHDVETEEGHEPERSGEVEQSSRLVAGRAAT